MSRKMTALVILFFLFPLGAYAQIGDKVAERFINNVVQLTVKFSDGEEKNGFGFVVGEQGNQLYAVTANHVLHSDNEPDVKPTDVQVRFYQDQAGKPLIGEPLSVSSIQIDAALFRVPKPENYQWEKRVLSPGYKKGDKAWFVGRQGKWFIPPDRDAGCFHDSEPDWEGCITLSFSAVQRGTSGAPLFTESGIVGMIVADEGSSARAVHIDPIRKLVKEKCPWQLQKGFSSSESVFDNVISGFINNAHKNWIPYLAIAAFATLILFKKSVRRRSEHKEISFEKSQKGKTKGIKSEDESRKLSEMLGIPVEELRMESDGLPVKETTAPIIPVQPSVRQNRLSVEHRRLERELERHERSEQRLTDKIEYLEKALSDKTEDAHKYQLEMEVRSVQDELEKVRAKIDQVYEKMEDLERG